MLLHLRPPPSGATRLDHATLDDPVEFVRELAAAIDALDAAGITAPAITRGGIWVDAGDVFVKGAAASGESPAAELARMLEDLQPRRSAALGRVLTRARDGAYLSAGQFAAELERVETSPRRRWWRRGLVST